MEVGACGVPGRGGGGEGGDNEGRGGGSFCVSSLPFAVTRLLENGNLLRTAKIDTEIFTAGGYGGRIEEYDWDGNLVWEYEYASDLYFAHHDFATLPNGNVLILAWDRKTAEDAIAAGRDPRLLEDGELWAERIIEVRPTGASGGEIGWEWSAGYYCIQDGTYLWADRGNAAVHP